MITSHLKSSLLMIVIVEPNSLVRSRLFCLLGQGSLFVRAFSSPEALLRWLGTVSEPVTLILCGSNFRQLSGIEFLRRVRAGTYPELDADVLFLLMYEALSDLQLEEAHHLGAITVEKPRTGGEIGSIAPIHGDLLKALAGFASAVNDRGATFH